MKNRAFVFFFAVVFIGYLILSFSYDVILWDTATFFTNAKVFRYGHGFFEWSLAPFFPFILAIYPVEIFGRITSAVFGLIGVITVYLLGKQLYNEKVGFYSALLLAINPLFAYWSAAIHSDIPSFAFMSLAVLSFLKSFKNDKWLYLFGVFIALAFLTRYVTILIIIPVFLYIAYCRIDLLRKKEMWLAVVLFFILITPWMVFNYQYTKNPLTSFIRATETISSMDIYQKPEFYYIQNFHLIYSVCIPFFFLALIFTNNRRGFFFPIMIFLVFFIILSLTSYKFPRHVIPSFLGFSLISGHGLSKLITMKKYSFLIPILAILLFIPAYLYLNPFTEMDSSINNVCDYLKNEIPSNSVIISTYWVYWNNCGYKSVRWYEQDKEFLRSKAEGFQEYLDGYRVRYAIVSDYDLWPPGINTSYMENLSDFMLAKKIGNFALFEYKNDFSGEARSFTIEYVFYK